MVAHVAAIAAKAGILIMFTGSLFLQNNKKLSKKPCGRLVVGLSVLIWRSSCTILFFGLAEKGIW